MFQGVLISRDHYDRLEVATMRTPRAEVRSFLTALGVGQHLQGMGAPVDKIWANPSRTTA